LINTQPLNEQVETALKEEIFSGRLQPGQRVSIEQLARQVGTSYTPVRDAVKRLAAIGMMKVCPRKEVRVEQLDQKRLKDLFEVRIALELIAIPSAIKLIPEDELRRAKALLVEGERCLRSENDPEVLRGHDGLVHRLILDHCDNQVLPATLGGLLDLCIWAHRSVVRIEPGVIHQGVSEHLAILQALRARSVATAKRALADHLKRTLQRTLRNCPLMAAPPAADGRD
jgi:DNA-binding GntR family transcriptional regulator